MMKDESDTIVDRTQTKFDELRAPNTEAGSRFERQMAGQNVWTVGCVSCW